VLQPSDSQAAVGGGLDVIAEVGGDPHHDRVRHRHLEFEVTQDGVAHHDVGVAVEGDVPRADEGGVEPFDRMPATVRAGTDGVLDLAAGSEQPHPRLKVVCAHGDGRLLDGGQQLRGGGHGLIVYQRSRCMRNHGLGRALVMAGIVANFADRAHTGV
jgi:hypothetical protein